MSKITIVRDPYYAPCCYLICRIGTDGQWNTKDDNNTVLVQSDYDWPSIAGTFGWTGDPDDLEQISAAGKYLDNNLGKVVDDPGYFDAEDGLKAIAEYEATRA